MFRLLDVAIGPTILMFGLIVAMIIGVVAILVFFSIKAIRKIKADRDKLDG